MTRRAAPADLVPGGRGRRVWRELLTAYDFGAVELTLVHEALRTMDRVDALDALVARDGMMVEGSKGQSVLHPAVGEARMQRQLLRAIAAQLDLPDIATADAGEGSNQLVSLTTVKARRAARARWARRGVGA